MMQPDLFDALNDCIDRIAAGQSLQDCLEAYPQYETELYELLTTGQQISIARADDVELAGMRQRITSDIDRVIFSDFILPDTQSRRRLFSWGGLAAALLLVIAGAVVLFISLRPDDEIEVLATDADTPTATIITNTPIPTLTFTQIVTQTNVPTATITNTPTPTMTLENLPIPNVEVLDADIADIDDDDECEPPEDWVEYTIQPDDTLSEIADETDTTIEEIREINCLEDQALIIAGETLFVPEDIEGEIFEDEDFEELEDGESEDEDD